MRHMAMLVCVMVCVAGGMGSQPRKELAEEAITLSGQRVMLYKDGSWEYKRTKDPNEVLFRGVPWGATADEVRRQIKEKPLFDGEALVAFADTVGSLKAHCVFKLVGGRFVRGQYQFAEEHVSSNLFFEDFDQIDALLSKKYGKPATTEKVWKEDLFKDRPDKWGRAVEAGHLMVHSQWRAGQVTITHLLHGDNFKVTHRMEYKRDDMETLEHSIREQEDQKKL